MVKFIVGEDFEYAKYLAEQELKSYKLILFEDLDTLKAEINQINFFTKLDKYLVLDFVPNKKNQWLKTLQELDHDKMIIFVWNYEQYSQYKSELHDFNIQIVNKFNVSQKRKIFHTFLKNNHLENLINGSLQTQILQLLPNDFAFFITELPKIALVDTKNFVNEVLQVLKNYDEVNIFSWIDQFFSKNLEKAIQIWNQNQTLDFATKLINLLAQQIYKLLLYKQIKNQNLIINDFFKSSYEIQKMQIWSQNYNIKQLTFLNQKLLEIDYKQKNFVTFNLFKAIKLLILQWNDIIDLA